MEAITKQIRNNLKVLEIREMDIEESLETETLEILEIEYHARNQELKELYNLKQTATKLQVEADVEIDAIQEWTLNFNKQIKKHNDFRDKIKKRIEELKEDESNKMRHIEETIQKRKKEAEEEEYQQQRQRQIEELELQKARAELQINNPENAVKSRKDEKPKVRLPKHIITPFNGTHMDWQRFWNQFEVEIDKSDIAQVTKLSYLKELVIPKVRLTIDGLPFNAEGYERAKNILKDKYGKTSEIVNVHIQRIMQLPTVYGTNPKKIYDFYEKLSYSIQVLDTMGRLNEINGNVRMTLDKIPQVRPNLVMLDPNWKDWKFGNLVAALKNWTERNPPTVSQFTNLGDEKDQRKDRLLHTRSRKWNQTGCVYCNSVEHKSTDCNVITDIKKRREMLSHQKRCFNCTGIRHRANECRSKQNCQQCQGHHHTSICGKIETEPSATTAETSVIYPVVIVNINGIKCRALCDTGAGSSYISSGLSRQLKIKPWRKDFKRIEMMMHTVTKRIDIYKAEVTDVTGKFKMVADFSKVDKDVLLKLPNPKYKQLLSKYKHLSDVTMNDEDNKSEQPIHIILGAPEYSRIKTSSRPKIGEPGEPVAEYTSFGWTLMSPGKELDLSNVYLTQSSTQDYERLCKLDVLGLEECHEPTDNDVYQNFLEQLGKDASGRYLTSLLWKPEQRQLKSNKTGSIARLKSLLGKLEKDPELMDKYDQIIQDQLEEGIVERANQEPTGKEFYIPHKPVIKESAESTKIRIVYDASAREKDSAASLNDCLETGPPLQNQLFNVLIRSRMKPIALTGDMKQAFLQICIRKEDRDSLRFHWIKDKNPATIETLRFTRAIWGLVQSPFLLGGTVKHHLHTAKLERPQIAEQINEIQDSLYVDDIITGGETMQKVAEIKQAAISVFKLAKIELHKWHSNIPELEDQTPKQSDQTYAKQQLSVKPEEIKILGLPWNKKDDRLGVTIPQEKIELTKRGILHYLASIYDPLGLISPIILTGKQIFREACQLKLQWDQPLADLLVEKWNTWIKKMPDHFDVPRSIPQYKETAIAVELHGFADASAKGVCAVVYGVVYQSHGISKGLMASKSRLSKDGLTIPRLELVAMNMTANLLQNVKDSIKEYNITLITGWSDSTVALHWTRGNGCYKQFVSNRVKKIKEKDFITWRYIPTDQNPADLGSRGCAGNSITEMWLQGPHWLATKEDWPPDIVTAASPESKVEVKLIKDIFSTANDSNTHELQELLEKHTFWKTLRICSWLHRFQHNSLQQEKLMGPITSQEILQQKQILIKWAQQEFKLHPKFEEVKSSLNLETNKNEILECRGRIQGDYPIFIPNGILAEKLIEDSHLRTLHGGVSITMTNIRMHYWIPKLRQKTKQIIRRCYGCKRFQATSMREPVPGLLPKDRTEGHTPFQVVGTDYAGPLIYKTKKGKERKVYILLFSCSLTRALHIELIANQTVEEFIKTFKRFVARRGRPSRIYSDNAKTFKAAANWLYIIMKSEKLHSYLANESIDWRLYLSRAPWWGGQFERMIGLVKQSLYKCIGKANLSWEELEEVLLDIETNLNNRPLSYVEDDIEMPVLTPNLMLFGKPSKHLLEDHNISPNEKELRRRAKYLKKCKDSIWQRWRNEYLKGLRERHNLIHKSQNSMNLKVGDVVMIKGDEKNRGKWRIGIITEMFQGKDNIVRAVRLRSGKTFLERAIQHLYPLELSCDINKPSDKIDKQSKTIQKRPVRKAATEARLRIKDQAKMEIEPPEVE